MSSAHTSSVALTPPHLVRPNQQTQFLSLEPFHGMNQTASPVPRRLRPVQERGLVINPIRPAENPNLVVRNRKEQEQRKKVERKPTADTSTLAAIANYETHPAMVGSMAMLPADTVTATRTAPTTLNNEHRLTRGRRGREKRSRTSERGKSVITASHTTENLQNMANCSHVKPHA